MTTADQLNHARAIFDRATAHEAKTRAALFAADQAHEEAKAATNAASRHLDHARTIHQETVWQEEQEARQASRDEQRNNATAREEIRARR